VAVACTAAWSAGAAVAVDYGVKLSGPIDGNGAPLRGSVPTGRRFYVRLDLVTDAPGAAAVTYDVDLPTGVEVPGPVRLANGAVTSTCLRACTIGWNATRSGRLSVYYAFLPPGPGAFVVEATIVSTNHADDRAGDDDATVTVVVAPARLTLGRPALAGGPPAAGRRFTVTIPVRRGGVAVRPASASCGATIGRRSLAGQVSLARGSIRCSWSIPRGTRRRTLRTRVSARAGPLRAAGSWLYAIG
jgi:hypothetical protein